MKKRYHIAHYLPKATLEGSVYSYLHISHMEAKKKDHREERRVVVG
jgi:hypothetical protein